jgi:hypothetical protein
VAYQAEHQGTLVPHRGVESGIFVSRSRNPCAMLG